MMQNFVNVKKLELVTPFWENFSLNELKDMPKWIAKNKQFQLHDNKFV